jgi:hypothetical protein
MDVQQTSKANLERLYLRWVMGKNRGVDAPLERVELEKLLKSGYVIWVDLSEKERAFFKNGPDISTNLTVESVGVERDKALTSYQIVQGLMLGLDEVRGRYYSDRAWNEYGEEEKKEAREYMFKVEYGKTPKDYGYMIYRQLVD